MVYFFKTKEGYFLYMGADKFENEELIRYGIPEDIWFHVDDISSAHVYLRLEKNQKLEDVPNEVIEQCGQLVKANSIEGCKMREVTVIYTRWRNLNKTSDMEVGAIGFHDRSKVKRIRVEKNNSMVNQLNKTKEERFPDLAELQRERQREFTLEKREGKRQLLRKQKQDKLNREEEARLRSYADVMIAENMKSNKDFESSVDDSAARNFEDDFM